MLSSNLHHCVTDATNSSRRFQPKTNFHFGNPVCLTASQGKQVFWHIFVSLLSLVCGVVTHRKLYIPGFLFKKKDMLGAFNWIWEGRRIRTLKNVIELTFSIPNLTNHEKDSLSVIIFLNSSNGYEKLPSVIFRNFKITPIAIVCCAHWFATFRWMPKLKTCNRHGQSKY